MANIRPVTEVHGKRVEQARRLFFERGEAPGELVDPVVARSWARCRRFGLNEWGFFHVNESLDRVALKTEQERNRYLISHSRPIMEQVRDLIRDTGSMVILADASGLLLETAGDADFVSRARRVALLPGASWDENNAGTNAIGTVLAEEAATGIFGAEHFLEQNGFLTCCASPIFGPDGRLLGVLDISGDYRIQQRHTLGLARLSSAIVEKRLFEAAFPRDMLACFHHRADSLGTTGEGLAAVSADGQVLAMNRAGLDILGIDLADAAGRDFSMVFESNLAAIVDRHRQDPLAVSRLTVGGRPIHFRLRGHLPPSTAVGFLCDTSDRLPASKPESASGQPLTLDTLNTGDAGLQVAIDRARRILGKDIPLLIQGESGVGKAMFAQAFHNSGPRCHGPFVAFNCASIPESLIESELFGCEDGREGATGRVRQANGGTLFLDDIGDLPPNLQSRLLRVLQERALTPRGSTRAVRIDILLVCATRRKLGEDVARGTFREDLYYRLNGLSLTLPPLRKRTDIRVLAARLTDCEAASRAGPVSFSADAMRVIESCDWPGNVRQLLNVIRVAIALLDDDETQITENHLPEEVREASALRIEVPAGTTGSLEEISRQLALRALEAADGNISAAARQLGISRNTLYRKLGRM